MNTFCSALILLLRYTDWFSSWWMMFCSTALPIYQRSIASFLPLGSCSRSDDLRAFCDGWGRMVKNCNRDRKMLPRMTLFGIDKTTKSAANFLARENDFRNVSPRKLYFRTLAMIKEKEKARRLVFIKLRNIFLPRNFLHCLGNFFPEDREEK